MNQDEKTKAILQLFEDIKTFAGTWIEHQQCLDYFLQGEK